MRTSTMVSLGGAIVLGLGVPLPAGAQQNATRPAAQPPQAAAQTPGRPAVRFPGTSWSIVPPAGFSLTEGTPTLLRHPDGAAILLIEGPRQRVDMRAMGEVGSLMNAGTPNEVRLEAIEPVTSLGRPAALMRLKMTRRPSVQHIIAVEGEFGNVNAYLLVPDTAVQPDAAAIRAALFSVAEEGRSAAQRLGDLPFRLTELAGMRVVSIVANSVVLLTDGPGDAMDEATDQPFVMVSRLPTGPRDRFDATRDLSTLAALVRERYQGATILSQKVEPTPQGPVATVVFQRTPPGKTMPVAGVAWTLAQGEAAIFMVGQFPPERSELPARFIRIRSGVKPR